MFIRDKDLALWLLALTATVYSLLLISSLQRSVEYNYLFTQIPAVVIGIISAIIISHMDYNIFIKRWWVFAAVGLILAVLVFIFGIRVEGTDDTAWIRLPGGISIQPSEFIKICFLITFTKHLTVLNDKDLIKKLSGILTLIAHALIPIVIIHLQGDDGTALIFALTVLVMVFSAGAPAPYFTVLGCAAVVFIPLLWSFVLNDEHRNRILALLDLDKNAMNTYGWQQYQGKVSIASGGLTGKGLFNGQRVEYGIVPEQQNDFIFTVAGEELGFIGCMAILLILLGIILRVLIDGRKTTDFTGRMLCMGIFAIIASQTVVNIGMVLGLIPVIGITLPFFSAGGSSVLSMLICIGIVQSVVRHKDLEPDKIKVKIGRRDRIKI